jgi:hypothetical protein
MMVSLNFAGFNVEKGLVQERASGSLSGMALVMPGYCTGFAELCQWLP